MMSLKFSRPERYDSTRNEQFMSKKLEEIMNESANMTSAVDAALDRVRGELVTLERAVAVLRGSIDDRGIPVGGQNLNWKSIDDSPGAARDWPGLHGVGQVLSKELWLPEYGAIQAPDDRG